MLDARFCILLQFVDAKPPLLPSNGALCGSVEGKSAGREQISGRNNDELRIDSFISRAIHEESVKRCALRIRTITWFLRMELLVSVVILADEKSTLLVMICGPNLNFLIDT